MLQILHVVMFRFVKQCSVCFVSEVCFVFEILPMPKTTWFFLVTSLLKAFVQIGCLQSTPSKTDTIGTGLSCLCWRGVQLIESE